MKETLRNLKRVYGYAREYRKNFIIFTLLSILFVAFNIVMPMVSARMIVDLSNNLYLDLLLMAIVMFVINIIRSVNHMLLRKNTQIFFRGTTKNIEMDAADSILKIELSTIDKKGSGTFIQRLTSDPNEMGHIYTMGMGYLTGILTNIGIFVAVFLINKIVFVYYLFISIVLSVLFIIRSKKMNEKDKIYRYANQVFSSTLWY